MQKLINKSFKLSENEIHFLSILKEKYHIKINRFVRELGTRKDYEKKNKLTIPF